MPPAQTGSQAVQSRKLRTELRNVRESASLTQQQVAQKLHWSTSKIVRIETGTTDVSPSDVLALLHIYGISDPERINKMVNLAHAKQSHWWDEYKNLHSKEFLNFLGYEASAYMIRQFQGLLVPDLLQTKGYATALFSRHMKERQQIDHAVRMIMQRQTLLDQISDRKFDFILDEAVIHRHVGNAEVMREQLTRLVELKKREEISIRIVPFTAGAHLSMQGSFTILELDPARTDSIVKLDGPCSNVHLRDDPQVASKYLKAFSDIQEIAPPKDINDQLIKSALDALSQWMCD